MGNFDCICAEDERENRDGRGFCVGLGLFPGAAGRVNWPARSIGLQAGLPCCMTGWRRISPGSRG